MVLLTSLLAALYPARQILKKRLSEALAEKH
jgi:ABC-type lipoprotein release transport system permease subunit